MVSRQKQIRILGYSMQKKTKQWTNDDYGLFENDGEKTEETWNVKITIVTPDGITNSRMTRIISRALSDSNYLYGEATEHTVSADLVSSNTLPTQTKEEVAEIVKEIKETFKKVS